MAYHSGIMQQTETDTERRGKQSASSASSSSITATEGTVPPASSSSSTTPCAACKMLRRRCGEKCSFAPYFPSHNMPNFAVVHKIFGASNLIKLLQEIPREKREDAVKGMVYEARARIRDPVYGCAGIVSQMQSAISELKSQLASAQAEILSLRLQLLQLMALFPALHSAYADADADASQYDQSNLFSHDFCSSQEKEKDDTVMLWETFCNDLWEER